MYKTKTEQDLVYEENKDIIRAQVRFEVSTLYKRRTNFLLDEMTKRFKEAQAQGVAYRLAPELSDEMKAAVEYKVDEILGLPPGDS